MLAGGHGCAGKLDYAPAPRIELAPPTSELAQTVNGKIADVLADGGDFHPNDLVRLSFPYLPLLTGDQRVQNSGLISPPLLPPVQTRGLSAAQLQARLIDLYRPRLEIPAVSVSVIEYHKPPPLPEIFVMGEVTRPGAFPHRDGTSLFEGLARAGGANRDADLERVVLIMPEGDHLTARMVDLQAVLGGRSDMLPTLSPFSIVIVPPTGFARAVDRARQIRAIIGFNGINVGSSVTLIQP